MLKINRKCTLSVSARPYEKLLDVIGEWEKVYVLDFFGSNE